MANELWSTEEHSLYNRQKQLLLTALHTYVTLGEFFYLPVPVFLRLWNGKMHKLQGWEVKWHKVFIAKCVKGLTRCKELIAVTITTVSTREEEANVPLK